MEGEALVPVEPLTDLRVLVGGVVVKDDVDQLTGRDPASMVLRNRMNS